MAIQPIKRKYSFSDGELSELGDALIEAAERDLTQMTTFGFDQTRLDTIKDKIAAFKIFPPDEYYTGRMMEATAAKDLSISVMSNISEGIVMRATNKFGKDTPKVKGFGWTGYITKPDADKMVVNRLVFKMGTDHQPALASEGLTVAILADLELKITDSDNAITLKRKRVSERDVAVNERITLGNELYAELVKLADTGKHIWEDSDESKYNDYVIYETSPGSQTVTGTVPVSSIHQPSVVVNSPADEINITVTAGKVTAYFAADPTDEPAPGQTTFTIEPGTPFDGTATQLDWSAANFRLLLKNDDTAAGVPFTVVVRG